VGRSGQQALEGFGVAIYSKFQEIPEGTPVEIIEAGPKV